MRSAKNNHSQLSTLPAVGSQAGSQAGLNSQLLIAVVLFLLLPILFHTYVFQNRVIIDERYVVYLPDRYLSAVAWNRGEIPLWNPYVQCGAPHLGLHHVGALYPPNILAYAVLPPAAAFNLLQWLHYSLAGIGAFLLVRLSARAGRLGGGFGGGLWAGIVFMFCGFLMAHETHTPMDQSAAWLPLIFYFLVRLREKGDIASIILCALALTLQLLAGYMQVWAMTAFAALLYGIYDAVTERRVRVLAQVLGALVLGLALSSAQILATSEVVRETVRERLTYEQFVQYSFPRYLFPMLLFPYLFGTNFPDLYPTRYFGPWNLHEMTGYVGTAPLVLVALGLMVRRREDKARWFWFILAVVALLFVMGDDAPFYRVMYHVPVYNLFRAPARHWLLFGFAVSVLSGLGLAALIREKEEQSSTLQRHVPRFAGAGYLLAAAIVSLVLLYSFGKILRVAKVETGTLEMLRENFRMRNPAIWIPLALMVLGAASFIFAGKARSRWAFAPLFIVLLLEFAALRHSLFIGAQETDILFENRKRNPVYAFLTEKEKHPYDYRIFPVLKDIGEGVPELLYPCINQCCSIQSICGYGPFLPKNHIQLLGMYNTGVSRDRDFLIRQNRVISEMNVKYLLVADNESHRDIIQVIESARRATGEGRSAPLYELRSISPEKHIRVYENRAVRERAFVASSISAVTGVDEMINMARREAGSAPHAPSVALQAPRAVLRQLETLTTGTALIRSYGNNRVRIATKTTGQGVLVLADSFFAGWRAYVDGARVGILRADTLLRAVIVPPGRHIIDFVYTPKGFQIGLFLSLIVAAFLCFLATLSLGVSRTSSSVALSSSPVILSPSPVILSEAKNLVSHRLRVNSAKNLASHTLRVNSAKNLNEMTAKE
jgi:hypothetical protein